MPTCQDYTIENSVNESEKERYQNSNVCFSVESLGFKVCDWGNRIKISGIIQSHTHIQRERECQAALIAKEASLKLTSGTEVIIIASHSHPECLHTCFRLSHK